MKLLANGSVAYPIGTAISFVNMTSQVVSIAITRHINAWLGGADAEAVSQDFFDNLVKGV